MHRFGNLWITHRFGRMTEMAFAIREANMAGLVAMTVLTGAMALALMAIWSTVAPQWRRIVRLAAGRVEAPVQPLADLARAECRIAVRRWAAAPVPVDPHRRRAVA